jgi:hypothetical protein
MKAKIMAVCLILALGLLLSGCAWWDELVNPYGTSGPGASWLIVDDNLEATAQAGAQQFKAQLTAISK